MAKNKVWILETYSVTKKRWQVLYFGGLHLRKSHADRELKNWKDPVYKYRVRPYYAKEEHGK